MLAVCLQSSVSAFPSTSSTSPSTSTSLIQVYMIDTKLTIETTQRKVKTEFILNLLLLYTTPAEMLLKLDYDNSNNYNHTSS